MVRKKSLLFMLVLVMVLAAAGCSFVQPIGAKPTDTPKPFSMWTPQEKAAYFNHEYLAQLNDTARMGADPLLSEGQLVVYRAKRKILIEMKPYVVRFSAWANGGPILQPGDEQAILGFIDQIARAGS